ncbi:hypothetical protein [Bradyrhizobium sp. Tv2a-2]|uniref:hypothetical protein n=1 Tax=Bradyrhizobium sp. Tv2a-2 TaxID=113395 RepID=UPI00046720C2|nr:hypothetical protein [Bradyrhizobium sp. Tv2a-2]
MTTLCNQGAIGSRHAFQRSLHRSFPRSFQVWAYERLLSLNLGSGDPRFAAIALVSGVVAAAGNAWFETIARRAHKGAKFARRVTAADTMVAAGGR